MNLEFLRQHIQQQSHTDEHSCMVKLTFNTELTKQQRLTAVNNAKDLVEACREDKHGKGTLDAFLLEFGLSNKEGVALMCLAEALLRIPDTQTADRLIAEKIHQGHWAQHLGQSDSLFVNASTWGLMLTGGIVKLDPDITEQPDSFIRRLTTKLGEPLVRAAVYQAMRIMGGHYVLGRTIDEGIKRGQKENPSGTRFSFDMLGEGARTEQDAQRYFDAYAQAIDRIGLSLDKATADPLSNHVDSISVKLSALHPRYHYSHHATVIKELLPRITQLCLKAKTHQIGLSIDAEEAERLDISLDIFQALATDQQLQGWQGLGFVLQAYQKRAPHVVKWLIQLAKDSQRQLKVRLVKGAYWDAEIKQAQEQGLTSYPVFTRKANTDICYQHCARLLLDAPTHIFPQFATHNAYTATIILELASDKAFEFQRLHGMGELLYQQLAQQFPNRPIPVRVYAPIGQHKDLLPYLVRRLLENGANSSFVNGFLDKRIPTETLISDAYQQATEVFPYQHPLIPIPGDLFNAANAPRKNARGIDLNNPFEVKKLLAVIQRTKATDITAGPIVGGSTQQGTLKEINNPANRQQRVGRVIEACNHTIASAIDQASQAQTAWNTLGGKQRSQVINRVADQLESHYEQLISLLALEAGRTLADGVSEVREAIDFCRYYALQGDKIFTTDSKLQGCGTFLCISPWNFPLAIFVGQISAALMAGNAVIAKPAEQTPLIAATAIQLFHRAGVPTELLHLLTGDGATIGKQLINDPRLSGVAFTGSTETAVVINRQLASRPSTTIPLIAETGGQNCMIVDSSALPEQVIDDVITSSFLSAGQRCSALRVLFLQEEIADSVITMLKGAMASLVVGDPSLLATDIGPVIDSVAQKKLQKHIEAMHQKARFIATTPLTSSLKEGSFIPPHAFEIDSLEQLAEEVFGPILHIIRYRSDQLDQVIEQINQTGYGLTLGIHSRIEAVADYIYRHTQVGNTYINRNMVGAVVEVNPFGGQGLSGTGPKAGGPNYLYRFARPSLETAKQKNNKYRISFSAQLQDQKKITDTIAQAGQAWHRLSEQQRADIFCKTAKLVEPGLGDYLAHFSQLIRQYLQATISLPGPTGEDNQLSLTGKNLVACIAQSSDTITSLHRQIVLALAAGCPVIVLANTEILNVLAVLTHQLQKCGMPAGSIQLLPLEQYLSSVLEDPRVKAVLSQQSNTGLSLIKNQLANRPGAITPLIEVPTELGYEHIASWYSVLSGLLVERTRTDNLVAKGGNTQLFSL